MLDILLSRLKEEIAIDGITGSSIETVWEYTESILKESAKKSGASMTPLVDDKYKSFIWNYLRFENDLEFHENIAGKADAAQQDQQITNHAQEIQPIETTEGTGNNYQGAAQNMEIDDGLIDNNEINFNVSAKNFESKSVPNASKKRKEPPASKKKTVAKKAKAKPKKKPKKKSSARASAANSEDDFEAGSESESSSSEESDFEQDVSDEDSEDEAYGIDSEASESEQVGKHRPPTVYKQSKNPTGKPKKVSAVTVLSPIENISSFTFGQINEKYGNTLYITGSPELQERQLYVGMPPGGALSPNLVVILKEIIKTRSKGLFQATVTKILDIDGRSTGHYCKSLEDRGAIVRNGVSTNKIRTNICTHIRFVGKNKVIDIDDENADTIPYNVNSNGVAYSQKSVRDALINLIKDAPEQAMLSEDVLRALAFDGARRSVRKWFNRIIDEICTQGYIKKTNLRVNGVGLGRRCLHLLKVPIGNEKAEDLPIEPLEFPIKIKTMQEDIPILHVLIDSPLENQILQVLLAAGTNGATQREIAFTLNLDENRILYKLLEKMVEMTGVGLQRYGALRFLEFEGRQRRYRYFSYLSYKKRYENIDVEFTPLPVELDESNFYETNTFIDTPHSKKEFDKFILRPRNSNSAFRFSLKQGKRQKADPSAPQMPKGRPKKEGSNRSRAVRKSTYVKVADRIAAAAVDEAAATDTSGNTEPATTATIPTSKAIVSTSEAIVSTSESIVSTSEAIVSTSEAIVSTSEATAPTSEATVATVSIFEGAPISKATVNKPTPVTSQSTVAQFFNPPKRGRPRKNIKDSPAKKAKHTQNGSGESTIQDVVTSVEPMTIDNIEPSVIILIDSMGATSGVESASVVESLPPIGLTTPIENIPAIESTPAVESVTEPVPSIDPGSNTSAVTDIPKPISKGRKELKPEVNKKANFKTPPARNLRKRTIADYFAKAAVKVTDEPNEPALPIVPEQATSISSPEIIKMASPVLTAVELPVNNTKNLTDEPAIISPEPAILTPERSILTSDPMIVTPEVDPVVNAEIILNVSQGLNAHSDVNATVLTDAQSASPVISDGNSTKLPAERVDFIEATNTVAEQGSLTGSASVPPIRNTTNTATIKKGRPHKVAHQINSYMEYRAKVLLALLEDKPIWEMNKDLMDAYIAKAEEISGVFKYTVCTRTLWRTASLLSGRKLAQTVSLDCPLLHGGFTNRKLLIRNDIDIEGPECKKYQKQIMERRALQLYRGPSAKYDTTTAPVERLEGRITRLKVNLQRLEEEQKVAEATNLKEQIGELSHNAQKFKPRKPSNFVRSWLIMGVQFGWIRARLLRVKTLYTYMFSLLMRENTLPGVEKESRTISTITFVTNMKVGVLCQIIGVFKPSEKLLEFLGNAANMDLPCNEVPDDIRKELFSDGNRFRSKLRALLFGMQYLNLVVPNVLDVQESQKYKHLAISYHLTHTVSIKDLRRRGQPVLREHTLESQADVALYWSELQYACTQIIEEIPEEDAEPEPTNPREREYWKGIYNPSNWTHASVMTRQQRKTLNSYVDKVNGTTPLENNSTCLDVAEEANLSIADVRRYFIKIEAAIDRKKKSRALKEYERRLYPGKCTRRRAMFTANPNGGRRVINLSSTRAFNHKSRKVLLGMKAQYSTANEHERLEGEDSYMDNFTATPVIVGAPEATRLRVTRSKRTVWTVEEDDLLIYCYIIVRQRARGVVRWHSISQVFPQKVNSACRHRINKLLADAKFSEQIESGSTLWRKFYAEGLRKGEIEDPDPYEIIKFDLLSLLSYFLKRLNDNVVYEQHNTLPKTVDDLNRCFQKNYNESERKGYYFEDQFDDKPTTVQKTGSLHLRTITGRRCLDSDLDNPAAEVALENTMDGRNLKILMMYSMMTLLTPTEVFDPFLCYAIINSYPRHVFDDALQTMRDRNCLILSKQERSIPGTKFSMSARFNTLMCGRLPQALMEQARKFDTFLSSQPVKNRLTPEYISSGMMSCIVDLLSDDKIVITMADREARMKFNANMSFTSRLTDRSLTIFAIDIEKTGSVSNENCVYPREVNIIRMDDLKFDVEFGYFLKRQDFSTKTLAKQIVSALRASGDMGLTLYQLKVQIGSKYDDAAIKRGIRWLEDNEIALVCAVGFGALRYVTVNHIGTWSIDAKEFLKPDLLKFRADSSLIPKNIDFVKKKDIIMPTIWTDTNGNRTDVVFRDCKKVVVDFLIRKPGSSEARIQKKFKAAFERTGLRTLLDALVEQSIVRRVQVTQCSKPEARKSIFSKTRTLKCCTEETIEESTRTFYWVLPNITVKNL